MVSFWLKSSIVMPYNMFIILNFYLKFTCSINEPFLILISTSWTESRYQLSRLGTLKVNLNWFKILKLLKVFSLYLITNNIVKYPISNLTNFIMSPKFLWHSFWSPYFEFQKFLLKSLLFNGRSTQARAVTWPFLSRLKQCCQQFSISLS